MREVELSKAVEQRVSLTTIPGLVRRPTDLDKHNGCVGDIKKGQAERSERALQRERKLERNMKDERERPGWRRT